MSTSTAPTLPPISTLNTLPPDSFSSTVALLFEPVPALTEPLLAQRPYSSYTHLIQKATSLLSTLSAASRLDIINAHPRIGAPSNTLSALSAAEQAKGSSDASPKSTGERLKELNDRYEEKYGFRFVVFVDGRSREEIVPVLEQRLKEGTRDGEMEVGLGDMMLIAKSRLAKLTGEAS
ncbi:hypothetical protein HKX48_008299 [Thoreauomyces humboldtii]|nr:hypothetical protein HKX48_008299 [Thoreauomyces humboldtii]